MRKNLLKMSALAMTSALALSLCACGGDGTSQDSTTQDSQVADENLTNDNSDNDSDNNSDNNSTENDGQNSNQNNNLNSDLSYDDNGVPTDYGVKVTPVSVSSDFKISDEDADLYNALFDENSMVKVEVDIDSSELKKMQDDYDAYDRKGSKSPIYRKCNLKFTINDKEYVIEEVGVRMKGNTSRHSFYDSSKDEIYSLVHYKFSFNELFDDEKYYGSEAKVWDDEEAKKEREDRTFASLSGMEMKYNHDYDGTYVREIYAFKMYRAFGVLAPNVTLCSMMINNNGYGVYKIYEPVDKTFIKRYLGDEDKGGDLYKCTWGSGPANYTSVAGNAGVKDEDAKKFYTYDLKTNKKTSTHESLKNLVNTAKNCTKEQMAEIIDIDNWLKFAAVSYFLGMPDDYRNNYNNHYLYFRASDNKAMFIGYDCEISLGINSWNPKGDYMTSANPFSGWAYGNNNSQANSIVCNTIKEGANYQEEFKKVLNTVADSKWMTYDNFKELYYKYYDHYTNKAIPSANLEKIENVRLEMNIDDVYGGGQLANGNMQVKTYLEKMLENYNGRRD